MASSEVLKALSGRGRTWKPLARELCEEIAGTGDLHSPLYVLERGGERQYFYLARVHSWSADPGDRTGPDFADPAFGLGGSRVAGVRPARLVSDRVVAVPRGVRR